MNIKKFFFIIVCPMFFCLQGFSESLGLEILKKSDLSIEAPLALTIGDIRNYAKTNYGFEIKFGTELADFNSKKIIDDITVYNTISIKLQDDRSVKVYCNGQYIYTIKGYSIKYGQLAMQMNSSGDTYYKIKKVMH